MDTTRLRNEFNRMRNKGILAEECGTVCVGCGAMDGIAYHHIVPLAVGGDNRISNIVPLCECCHGKVHGTNMTCLRRLSTKAGRPKAKKPKDADKIITEYIKCKISMKEAKERLGLSKGTKITDLWYYKAYLERAGIVGIERKSSKKESISRLVYDTGTTHVYVDGEMV